MIKCRIVLIDQGTPCVVLRSGAHYCYHLHHCPSLIDANPVTEDASHKWREVVLVEHIQVDSY